MTAEPRALPPALRARLERELQAAASVWMSPALSACVVVPTTIRQCEEPGQAEVAIVYAEQLSEQGDVDATLPGPTRRVTAIMVLGDERRILERLAEPGLRVSRVLTELGVLDARPEGLVVVELAKGVSAVDLQQRAEPTLLISPEVEEMKA